MAQILMMQGLPASGKSTHAKELVKNGEGNWKRVNKDTLRLLLDEGRWSKQREKATLAARDAIVKTMLKRGLNVIVDDTNFAPIHETRLREIATECGAEFHTKLIDTDLETCLKRNRLRPQPEQVPDRVILDMYNKYIPKPSWKRGPDECIIIDIDGTVADMEGIRGPYNQDKCDQDKPIESVIAVVESLIATGYVPIFLSGREGTEDTRDKTTAWIQEHIPSVKSKFWNLHLRKKGDKRADWIVKQELFMNHVAGRYTPLVVIDDRPCCVRLWRHTLGLTVLQVNDIEF